MKKSILGIVAMAAFTITGSASADLGPQPHAASVSCQLTVKTKNFSLISGDEIIGSPDTLFGFGPVNSFEDCMKAARDSLCYVTGDGQQDWYTVDVKYTELDSNGKALLRANSKIRKSK